MLGLLGEVHMEGGDFVLGLEQGCDFLETGEGQSDEENAEHLVVRGRLLLHDKKIGPELYAPSPNPKNQHSNPYAKKS